MKIFNKNYIDFDLWFDILSIISEWQTIIVYACSLFIFPYKLAYFNIFDDDLISSSETFMQLICDVSSQVGTYHSRDNDWLLLVEAYEITSDQYLSFPQICDHIFLKNFFWVIKTVIDYCLQLILIMFTITFLFKYSVFKFLDSFSYIALEQASMEFEHNVGNGEDLIMLISIVFSIGLLSALYFFIDSTLVEFKLVMYYIILAFILIPMKIFWSFGSFFINYIRGSSTFSNFCKENGYDLLLVVVYLTRFSLQTVRIILMYLLYFSLHEYVFVLPRKFLVNLKTSFDYYGPNVISMMIDFYRWLFEWIDTTISIINQLASLSFVIFWLFSYINTFELKKKKLFWFNKIIINFDFTNIYKDKKITKVTFL